MSQCEQCGVTFTMPEAPMEVTSTRILCPKCTAERLAEKRRLAAAKQAVASGARPASPPATRRENGPVRAAPPAEREPPPRRASAPPPPTRASRVERAARDDEAPAERTASRRRAAATAPAAGPDKAVLFGWGAAILLTIAAVVIALTVKSKKDEEAALMEAYRQKVDNFYTQAKGFDLTQQPAAEEFLKFVDANKDLWEGNTIAPDVVNLQAKARTNIQIAEEKAELQDRLNTTETQLKNPGLLSSEELLDLRRRLDDIEPKASMVGTEFLARVFVAKKLADAAYADRLLLEAKNSVGEGIEGMRAGLVKYTQAEDSIRKLFDTAFQVQDNEAKAFYEQRYRTAIQESDELCKELFTHEFIQAVPWRDLLAPDAVPEWNPALAPGFDYKFDGGSLHVIGPDETSTGDAILAIGDRQKWRDFVLDMEFTLVKGSCDVFMRLYKRPDATVESFSLTTDGQDSLIPGERYAASLTFIGSEWTLDINAPEFEQKTETAYWTKQRKGAVGLVFPIGSEMIVHEMRIKALR